MSPKRKLRAIAGGPARIKTRFRFRDELNDLRVVDVYPQRHRILMFEDSQQGAISLDDPGVAAFEYIGMMAEVVRRWVPCRRSLEIGGLGAGGLVHLLHRGPGQITCIEIDAMVEDLCRRFFRLPRDVSVVVGDVRGYVESSAADDVDVFMLDCFNAHATPPHLMTLEFMTAIRRRLLPRGILVTNIWDASCNALADHQLRTIARAFAHCWSIQCAQDRNMVVVAASEDPGIPGSIQFGGRDYQVQPLPSGDWRGASEVMTDENLALVLLDVGIA